MIEINKCKLVPGITANWGEILGDITKQQDLVDYIDSHGGGGGGGDAVWGSITGNLSDQTDLMSKLSEFATEQFVTSALSGYATESWVSSNFLGSTALSSYATQDYVLGQCGAVQSAIYAEGYITDKDLGAALDGYATESWVSSNFLGSTALSSYATQDYVLGQCGAVQSAIYAEGYITDKDLGAALDGYATESWVSSQGYLTSASQTITGIESRLSSIENTLGQAVQITNEILS